MPESVQSSFSRVFLIEDRAGPTHAPVYQGWWRAGAASWGQGDITLIYEPSSTEYNKFNAISKVKGEPDNPTLAIQARYTLDLSTLLTLVKRGCDHDLQVHFGKCRDPRDFNAGWDKVLVLEAAMISDYGTDDLGALDPSQRAVVNEDVTFTGEDLYEIKRLLFATKAAAEIVREVIDIHICDQATCGECGVPSDGCNVVIAITLSTGASPGTAAKAVYTEDGGANWLTRIINSLGVSEDPMAMSCVGAYVIVVSNDSASLHYILLTDLLNGTGAWAEMSTGFVGGGEPNAIFSLGPTYTWIVGDGGYIYFTEDPTNSVTVQDAGSATLQDLLGVHFFDELNGMAVGKSNAVVYTTDGGSTWASLTGPAVGVDLNCCWMHTKTEWFVGTAGGKLYYTVDSGVTWAEKTFPGSGAGSVKDIQFTNETMGYMAHNTAAPLGRILRTINGGYSWYVAPEGTATMPTNQGFNALAVCANPNVVYGGGVTTVAGDGILVGSS